MSYIYKKQLANAGNYGGIRKQIKYLIFHYTANDGDTDEANANFFKERIVQASAHYFVDDDSVTQSVPDNHIAWSVGDAMWGDCFQTGGGSMNGKINNTNSLSIEMCDTVRNGKYDFSEKTLANAAELGAKLMEKYDIDIDHVYRHFDVTGKHCPGVTGWWGKYSPEWAKFKERLKMLHKGYEVDPKLLDAKGLDNVPNEWSKEAVAWAKKMEIMYGDGEGDLLLRAPLTREAFVTMLHRFSKKQR